MNDLKNIIQVGVVDALTEKETVIEVDILQPSEDEVKENKTKRSFPLKPASLGTMAKISRLLLLIEFDVKDKGNWLKLSEKVMSLHGETIAMIIALAIVNRKTDPPDELVDFLLNNVSAKKMSEFFALVIFYMDYANFTTSIISIKGMNILEMSPVEQGS